MHFHQRSKLRHKSKITSLFIYQVNTREKKNESKMMKARLSTENIDITKKVRPREIVIKGDGRALKIKIKTIN